MNDTVSVDWKALILECGWLDRLERLTSKRFGAGGLAEEASSYVIDKLSQDNWQMLDAFKGNCKPETFLHTLANNLIEEFSRKRFGRPRPPEWLKRQGNFWVKVWKLLCLERQMPQSIVDLLSTGDSHQAVDVKKVMQVIKAKIPRCGEAVREIGVLSDDDNSDTVQDIIPDFNTPETQLDDSHLQEIFEILSLLLSNDGPGTRPVNSQGLNQVHQFLNLSDTEWIILRMVFQDGINLKTVAKSLGMKDYEPGRIKNQIIEKIRLAFTSANVDLDALRSSLG